MTDWTAFLTGWSIHILSVLIPWVPGAYFTLSGAFRRDWARCYGAIAGSYIAAAICVVLLLAWF